MQSYTLYARILVLAIIVLSWVATDGWVLPKAAREVLCEMVVSQGNH